VWLRKHHDGPDETDCNYTYLGVPLAVGDEVLGVLRVGGTDAHLGFSNYDQQIALSAATRLAGWLYQRQQGSGAEALRQLASLSGWQGSCQALASRILAVLEQGLGPCDSQVRLREQQRLPRLAFSGAGWERTPEECRLGEGLAGRVWASGRPFAYADATRDPRLVGDEGLARELPQSTGSGVCEPLLVSGTVVGTLQVHRAQPWSLSPRDQAFVRQVAAWGRACSPRRLPPRTSGSSNCRNRPFT